MDDVAGLAKARSLLILLHATCKQTQLALEAVANVLDTDLTQDLREHDLDRQLREPDVLAQAINDNRELWVMLYHASLGFEVGESST